MSALEPGSLKRILGAEIEAEAEAAAKRLGERADAEQLAEVAFAPFDSPLGTGHVAATERGLVAVALPNFALDAFLDQLAAGISPRVLELPRRVDRARRELDEYFEGTRKSFDLPLDWSLVRPGFYGQVLRETARLPFGVTATYGEVAARAGNPRAHRAAGTALGLNPIPIVVPCHRVLRAGGDVGGYAGGPERKRQLLRLEGALPPALA